MLSVTKVFRFEAAHCLADHPGRCRNLHGHSYELHVTVRADRLNGQGMVTDFGVLKALVNEAVVDVFDHSLILKKAHPLREVLTGAGHQVVEVDAEPTAEFLVQLFVERIRAVLPPRVELYRLKLWETCDSCAEWEG